jgi:hypothetical protein
MDLMLSIKASGFVEDMKATVWEVIFQNVAFLNSVSLKALSNELLFFFFTIIWKEPMLQEALFPNHYFSACFL